MGTNFYWREDCPNPCAHCGLGPIHVGKRSAGWSFGFRGYRHTPDPDHSTLIDDPSPFGFPVVSRADWRRVFTERDGRLVDEYGQSVHDAVAWLDALVAPDAKQQAKEDSPLMRGPSSFNPDPEWRDTEGFRFLAAEFS